MHIIQETDNVRILLYLGKLPLSSYFKHAPEFIKWFINDKTNSSHIPVFGCFNFMMDGWLSGEESSNCWSAIFSEN